MLIHFLAQVITLPPNILDLAPYLITVGFLGIAAPWIIRVLFPNADPVFAERAKLVAYLVIGALSGVLGLIPPDVLGKAQPWYAILVSVLAAFFANEVIYRGIQLVALRIMLGRDAFHQLLVNAQQDWRAAATKPRSSGKPNG